jgi:hypothetical protein
MAVKLKTEEITHVTQTLVLEQEVTDEEKRPLGLACAAVIEDFEWDEDDVGHDALQQLLKDIKNALGVRVSRKKKKAPAKKKAAKKKAAKKPAEEPTEDPPPADSNGDSSPTEAAAPPESGSDAGAGEADTGAAPDPGAPLHDPFAVPPGDQA